MGNFARVVRLALRYRTTVAASFICSLVVAVLWGGNIGFLYPLVEVVGNNQSLGKWADTSIAKAQATIATEQQAEAELDKRLATAAPAEVRDLKRERVRVEMRR